MATPHLSCFPADLTCLSVKHSSAVHSAHRARLPSHLLKTKFKSCFSLRTFSWLPIAVQVRAKPLFLAECTIGLRPLHAQPSWPLFWQASFIPTWTCPNWLPPLGTLSSPLSVSQRDFSWPHHLEGSFPSHSPASIITFLKCLALVEMISCTYLFAISSSYQELKLLEGRKLTCLICKCIPSL